MRYALRLLATMALPFGASACLHPTVISRPASSCSSLVPGDWKAGVQAPPLPSINAGLPDWQVFGTAAVTQLDKANSRTSDTIEIFEKCEVLVEQAQQGKGLQLFPSH